MSGPLRVERAGEEKKISEGALVCGRCGGPGAYVACSRTERAVYVVLFVLGVAPALVVWLVRSRLMGCARCGVVLGFSARPSGRTSATGLLWLGLGLAVCGLVVWGLCWAGQQELSASQALMRRHGM